MFKKINEGHVESDSGFSIQISGLEQLLYKENGKTLELEWNYDPRRRKTLVFISDLKNIHEEEKKRIKKNISEALKLLKGDYEIM